MRYSKTILVTGGAGFIGSNLLLTLVPRYPEYFFVNADALTYAGNLENLKAVEASENYRFEHTNITDHNQVKALFGKYPFSHVIHLAAESHVDRSIKDPFAFVHTNVLGTVHLLHEALQAWKGDFKGKLFYHLSTDEVYGSLPPEAAPFSEQHPYDPHSPYSASKAASDHFARAYHDTYGLPIVVSNCSNNYGPYQFPEKLIPLCIHNIIHKKPIPVYGDGSQIRDWLYVSDHVDAVDTILHKGEIGGTYNIGGDNEMTNIKLINKLIEIVDDSLGRAKGDSTPLISFVADRPGHDTRYAIDPQKIRTQLGWRPQVAVEEGLRKTVSWYLNQQEWLQKVTSGDYQKYYSEMYLNRGI